MSVTLSRTADSGLAGLSDNQLARRVHHVNRRLNDLGDRRLNISFAAHGIGGGGGLDPVATMEHNRRLDREGGRADLERELAVLNEEVKQRRGPPETETRSNARLAVSAVLIVGLATAAILGVVIFADEDGVEPIPENEWQPADTYLASLGEEPYDLHMSVACWPEVQVESVVETSQEVHISLIRRGPVDHIDPLNRGVGPRTCRVTIRLRDVLSDRVVIDATRDKEVTVTGRSF